MTKGQPQFTKADVDQFMRLRKQMQELLARINVLAAKTPDLAINKFKVTIVNEQIGFANEILGDARPFQNFEIFADGELPSNSDVVVVLSQYLACLELWRSERVVIQ